MVITMHGSALFVTGRQSIFSKWFNPLLFLLSILRQNLMQAFWAVCKWFFLNVCRFKIVSNVTLIKMTSLQIFSSKISNQFRTLIGNDFRLNLFLSEILDCRTVTFKSKGKFWIIFFNFSFEVLNYFYLFVDIQKSTFNANFIMVVNHSL